MSPMTPARRLAWTALMFGIAVICLILATVTHHVWPLFVAWIPLLAVPWILTRPETAGDPVVPDGEGSAEVAGSSPASTAAGDTPED
jgi:hypothetical protein